jgi:hypothetical protein
MDDLAGQCTSLEASDLLELETRLRARLRGRVQELRLEQSEGGLILRGCSRTYYGKQLAQHAVMDAVNLPILANEIEVL